MTPHRSLPWLALVITVGCGSNPSGTDPDAQHPPEDAMGPPVLVCGNPDVEAPIVWKMSPVNRAIGVDPNAPLVFDVADGCGIDMSTVVFRIAGTELTPTITGDAKNLRIQYDAPAGGFTLDTIIAAELFAADTAGNAVTAPMTIRIWDDFTIFLRAAAGLDSTTPTTVLGFLEYYHVEVAGPNEQRMVARMGVAADTAGAGLKYVSAQLHACARDVTSPRTIGAYRLTTAFDHTATSWINRSATAAWTMGGADAVPADRDATPFATLTFHPASDYWSRAASADMAAVVQAWNDDPTQNHGFVLVGAPGNVDINNGNCPLQVTGFLGRPLPL